MDRVALNKPDASRSTDRVFPSIYAQQVYNAMEVYGSLPKDMAHESFWALRKSIEEAYNEEPIAGKSTLSEDVRANPIKIIRKLGQELRDNIAFNLQQDVYNCVSKLFEELDVAQVGPGVEATMN